LDLEHIGFIGGHVSENQDLYITHANYSEKGSSVSVNAGTGDEVNLDNRLSEFSKTVGKVFKALSWWHTHPGHGPIPVSQHDRNSQKTFQSYIGGLFAGRENLEPIHTSSLVFDTRNRNPDLDRKFSLWMVNEDEGFDLIPFTVLSEDEVKESIGVSTLEI
jgi:proteasome lid subunit RPN8/RPN11